MSYFNEIFISHKLYTVKSNLYCKPKVKMLYLAKLAINQQLINWQFGGLYNVVSRGG